MPDTNVRFPLAAAVCCLCATASLCEPTPEELCDSVEGPFSVELGTGLESFRSFDEGDTLPYHRGPQGGTHIEAAARTKNLYFPTSTLQKDRNLPLVGFRVLDAADETVQLGGYDPFEYPVEGVDDGVGEIRGASVLLFEDGSVFVGREAILTVEVTDVCGNRATARRRFVIGDQTGGGNEG